LTIYAREKWVQGLIEPGLSDWKSDMMVQPNGHHLWLEGFAQVHDLLLDSSRGYVERASAAWQVLENLPSDRLPEALRSEWEALSKRATWPATAHPVSDGSGFVESAADIGSILLCIEWLLRRDLVRLRDSIVHNLHAVTLGLDTAIEEVDSEPSQAKAEVGHAIHEIEAVIRDIELSLRPAPEPVQL
jgi:hypothetical protein